MKGSISPKGVNEIVMATVVDYLKQKKSSRVINILEIGPGKGVFAEALSDLLHSSGIAFKMQCADIQPEQINSRNIGIECRYIDVQKEFQLKEQFDIIIAIELIEHLENPFHFVREIASHLENEGVLVLTSPNILSLRSRMRFFLTGCFDYFRRPYNEYWLNMGHVNPINPLQLVYSLRKNGFEVKKIMSNTSTFESLIFAPFSILIVLFSSIHFLWREKGRIQKKRNVRLMRFVLSPALLFGKTAIYLSVKKHKFIATPDVWHRSDSNFDP